MKFENSNKDEHKKRVTTNHENIWRFSFISLGGEENEWTCATFLIYDVGDHSPDVIIASVVT
jgi:hypothetical protein